MDNFNGGYGNDNQNPEHNNDNNQQYDQQRNQQYDQQYNQQHNRYNRQPAPPKTWLVESILATLFCCLPFGVIGIVNASRVESLCREGRYEEADRSSREAKKWTIVSFVVGIVGTIIYIGFFGVRLIIELLSNTNSIW